MKNTIINVKVRYRSMINECNVPFAFVTKRFFNKKKSLNFRRDNSSNRVKVQSLKVESFRSLRFSLGLGYPLAITDGNRGEEGDSGSLRTNLTKCYWQTGYRMRDHLTS